MYFAQRSLIPLLLIGLLLASCGQAPAGQPTPDINSTVAAAAETMAAALFQTQTAMAPAATDTALPTNTFLPTSTAMALPTASTATRAPTQSFIIAFTATPTGTFYTSTPLSSSLAVGCNNLRLIESFSSVSGNLTPGQSFTQSWQVENNGTCEWVYLYHLVHASGDRMGGSPPRLGKVIAKGKWTTLSVDLTAPNKDGTYNASWRFSDQGGTPFGASLPVSITVKKNPDPTATPDIAQTVAAGAQQTFAAQTQQAAVQNAVNTAIAQTAAANAAGTATASCGALQTATPGYVCP